jgi:hypothetical protein
MIREFQTLLGNKFQLKKYVFSLNFLINVKSWRFLCPVLNVRWRLQRKAGGLASLKGSYFKLVSSLVKYILDLNFFCCCSKLLNLFVIQSRKLLNF